MRSIPWFVLSWAVLLMVLAAGCNKTESASPQKSSSTQVDPKDWCAGHGVPESKCTKCHPKLIAKFRKAGDWCAEHGLPESVCPKCNHGRKKPTAHQTDPKDWCAGHGVPESKCTKCHPKLIAKFRKAGDWCAGHGFPESVCPKCNPVTPPSGQPKPSVTASGTVIRFRSASIERAAGIEVVPAARIKLDRAISCTAKIDFNRNRFAEIRSPVSALVQRLRIDTGQQVRRGAALFVLSSAHISALKSRLSVAKEAVSIAKTMLARRIRLRKSKLFTLRSVEKARLQLARAKAELASVRQSLRIGGISMLRSAGYFNLLSPLSGTVVSRSAVVGTQAGPGVLLATVADTHTMWALLDLNEWDASFVRVGQKVKVRVDGVVGRVFEGKLTWIAAHVDPSTRVVRARAEIKSHGLLRANQFGRATIQVAGAVDGVAVPLEAVQRTEQGSMVFVRRQAGLCESRPVQLGRSDGHRVQVKGQVKMGDAVVTTGAFLLRTELSKSSIGAGCCETKKPGGE